MKWVIFFLFIPLILYCREIDKLKFLYDLNNSISIPYVKEPPKIDGVVEKGEWSKMSAFTLFYDYEKGEKIFTSESPIIFSGYNEESLYFLFLVKYPDREIIANVDKRDGPVYKDDSVEIFIVPDDGAVYQFVINSKGIVADLKDKNFNWDGEIETRPFFIKENDEILNDLNVDSSRYWGLEVKIPFKNFKIENPIGKRWKLNFAVNYSYPKFVFSSLVKSFYEVDKYIEVKLLEKSSPYFQITHFKFSGSFYCLFFRNKIR